eukprot:356534-Chlamydomonas_euryale.AAC.10
MCAEFAVTVLFAAAAAADGAAGALAAAVAAAPAHKGVASVAADADADADGTGTADLPPPPDINCAACPGNTAACGEAAGSRGRREAAAEYPDAAGGGPEGTAWRDASGRCGHSADAAHCHDTLSMTREHNQSVLTRKDRCGPRPIATQAGRTDVCCEVKQILARDGVWPSVEHRRTIGVEAPARQYLANSLIVAG